MPTDFLEFFLNIKPKMDNVITLVPQDHLCPLIW
jgi:hypothetical protein